MDPPCTFHDDRHSNNLKKNIGIWYLDTVYL